MLTTFDTEINTSASMGIGEKLLVASGAGVLLGATSRAGQKLTDVACDKVSNWWNDRKENPPQKVMLVGFDPAAPTAPTAPTKHP